MSYRSNRSKLAAPHVITDTMPPTEQVDGIFYTSKRAFRAKGRELGLTEVGDQKFKPKRYSGSTRAERHAALERAAAQYKAGRRHRSR
jgi:hypothetical protein